MNIRWIIPLLLGAVLLAACSSQTPGEKDLSYRDDASTLVILADENTSPGGFNLGQECNHIPRLRIWGNGRTIYSDLQDGRRRVLVGQTSPEQITAILEKLDALDYFTNPPESSFNSTGTGYRVSIHLAKDEHNSFWGEPNAIYQTLLDAFDPGTLEAFAPETGYLVVGPALRRDLFPDSPHWPEDFGFSINENTTSREISGPALAFLWQAINEHPNPLTGIQSGDKVYAVAVFVEGISVGNPPFKCWNK